MRFMVNPGGVPDGQAAKKHGIFSHNKGANGRHNIRSTDTTP